MLLIHMVMKNKKIVFALIGLIFSLSLLMSSATSAMSFQDTRMVDAVIIFNPTVNVNLHGFDVTREYPAINGIQATIPLSFFYLLQRSWFVDAIEENRNVFLPFNTLDWGVDDIDAEIVWGGYDGATTTVTGAVAGQGIKVAVIDTGIDYDHPDLAANYKGGYNFVAGTNDPKDDNGHGTHCAGIVAAVDNTVGVIGVAPKADLYAVKVLDAQGSGSLADVVAGIDWAVANGMDVMSLSLGASSGTSSMEAAINNAYAAGVVVVAASGNDGKRAISYPAKYTGAIAVGATDQNRNLASFSNYGPEQEVVAPGVNIYSTMPTYTVTLNSWWYGGLSKNYAQMSGTSMACPMVAGLAALILSADPTLTAAEVRDLIRTNTIDLGATGWDETFGYGLVNAKLAIDAIEGTIPDPDPDPDPDPEAPAKVQGLTADVLSSSQIKLDWTANTESDLSHYNIYRNDVKIAETTTTSYTDSNLQAGTTYTYRVSAVSTADLEGEKSDAVSATTLEVLQDEMYVQAIDMWYQAVYWWIFLLGYDVYTKVTVYDNYNNPLSGATVYLEITLPNGNKATGNSNTGTDGSVTFRYQRGSAGTYVSTVTNLVKTGYIYNSALNVVTSATLTI